ncbi:hypothetical protein DFQ26_008656 [Actinomortierella ambigua]|nr:hypothetical protein DFQ26_008656 [Actinomortierella ambigua]
MLTLSPIERVATFTNTEGAMQFSLVDTTRLDLDSYQRSLARLAAALARRGQPLSSALGDPDGSERKVFAVAKRKCVFYVSSPPPLEASTPSSSIAATATTTNTDETTYLLTFVSNGMLSSLPNYSIAVNAEDSAAASSSSSSLTCPSLRDPPPSSPPPPSPLSPTSPVFSLPHGHRPPRYLLRLPLDPLKSPIESRLSAKRLGAADVHLLDGILRRLCDATPGAFRLFYSDGLSGMEHGNAIVYDGQPLAKAETTTTTTITTTTTTTITTDGSSTAAAVESVVESLNVQQQQSQQPRYLQKRQSSTPATASAAETSEKGTQGGGAEEDDDDRLLLGDEDGDNEFEIMLAGLDHHIDRAHGSIGAEDAHSFLWTPTLGL